MHRYHPNTGENAGTILFDDCARCEKHSKDLGLNLDSKNWQEMWNKMLDVELLEGTGHYASENELNLGQQMYHMYVALERYTTINPKDLPWRKY